MNVDAVTSAPERLVRWFDRWQGDRTVAAVPVAVVRKYADDRGSAMASLFTYYAFLALFPLLILVLTLFQTVSGRFPGLRDAVVDTVIGQLPVIGPMLRDETSSLAATGFGLAIGVLGLLWGATGLYNSAQLAMSQVWNVEGVNRMGLVSRLLRSLVLFAALFTAAGVSAAASMWGDGILPSSSLSRILSIIGSFGINVVMVFVALRIVTPPVVPWRRLALPAVLAGVAWGALQMLGHWLVATRLSRMNELYGVFAYAIGTLAWLTLMARVIVFSVEISVVTSNGLHPRRIAQPPLTDADREVLDRIVHNERRRPEQHIDIRWDDTSDDSTDDAGGSDPARIDAGDRS